VSVKHDAETVGGVLPVSEPDFLHAQTRPLVSLVGVSGAVSAAPTFWARSIGFSSRDGGRHGRALWRGVPRRPVPETLARHHPVMTTAPRSDGDCLICLWPLLARPAQRHQQIMDGSGRSMPVLYVESPRDLLVVAAKRLRGQMATAANCSGRARWKRASMFSHRWLPFSLRRYPRLNRLYLRLLGSRLRTLTRRLGFARPGAVGFVSAGRTARGTLGKNSPATIAATNSPTCRRKWRASSSTARSGCCARLPWSSSPASR